MDASTRSHFALFGLPERFALDDAALAEAWRRVQGAVHPDRFAQAGDAQRRVAMQWAAQANEAIAVLRDPVRRGAYLAERRGSPVEAESNTAMPAEFLVEQMQWREALDEAREANDAAARERLAGEVARERDRLIGRLAEALDLRNDAAEAARLVRRLMFVDRFAADLAPAG